MNTIAARIDNTMNAIRMTLLFGSAVRLLIPNILIGACIKIQSKMTNPNKKYALLMNSKTFLTVGMDQHGPHGYNGGSRSVKPHKPGRLPPESIESC